MKLSRLDAYDRRALKIIDEYGWMVQGVFPREGEEGRSFAYTVGLTPADLPELVIAGLPAELSAQLLNAAATQSHTRRFNAEPFTADQVLTDIASVALRVVEAPAAEVSMARRFYGDKVRSLQLVWPDAGGAYPGDPGWSLGDAQPLFDESKVKR